MSVSCVINVCNQSMQSPIPYSTLVFELIHATVRRVGRIHEAHRKRQQANEGCSSASPRATAAMALGSLDSPVNRARDNVKDGVKEDVKDSDVSMDGAVDGGAVRAGEGSRPWEPGNEDVIPMLPNISKEAAVLLDVS